jgi:hypothetical protein
MNKKITSTALAALMIAGSTSFSAFASMAEGTVVIGTKAYDIAYANDPANLTEIAAAIVAGGTVYFKDFNGNWVDNVTGAAINASVIPAVTYTNASGTTQIGAGDASVTAAKSVKVTAVAANKIKATFDGAVADTSKVTFALKGTAAIATTVTWNAAKTEATLQTSYNLAEASYTVAVTNDTVVMPTEAITITQQKVAKITINSTVLSVVPGVVSTTTPNAGYGFATYTVLDQYGNDITAQPLANNLSWTVGIGQVDSTLTKNGILAVKPLDGATIPLTYYSTASVNVYDTNTYVTTTSNLTVSQSSGVISNLTLNKITSLNNDDLNAGNTTGQWYIDYSALDASGNATDNYTLVNAGILSVNGGSYFDCKVVKNPNDNKKAAISVQLNSNASNLISNAQVPITVLTTNGKSSTINVTLKKGKAVDSFKVSAPDSTVASGETVILPYTAYDQDGTAITEYSKLNGLVNISISGGGSVKLIRNSDGTAAVEAVMPVVTSNAISVYINSNVTSTGKTSQLTLSVQKPVAPDSMDVDTTAGKQYFQAGGTLKLDFGYDKAGLTLNDQYDRPIDITNQDTNATGVAHTYYKAVATVSNPTVMQLQTKNDATGNSTALGSSAEAYNNNQIVATAMTAGTSSVNYEVWSVPVSANGTIGTAVDTGISQSVQYTVIKDTDITDYVLDTVANPIKILDTTVDPYALTNDKADDYAADPTVWGKTSGGALVRLSASKVVGASISSSDFTLSKTNTAATSTTSSALDFNVYAKKLANSTLTGATGTMTVTVLDSTGNYHNATTILKSTTDASAVSSVEFSASNKTGTTGLSVTGNTVTIDTKNANYLSNLNALKARVTKFDATTGLKAGASSVYFYAVDQFGTKDANLSSINVVSSFAASSTVASVDSNNILSISGTPAVGDSFVMTGNSANGHMQTVKVIFK